MERHGKQAAPPAAWRPAAVRGKLKFLLTKRIPRRLLTLFFGWFSKLEQPYIRVPSIAIWRFFSDLDLSEAKKSSFLSIHDCFIRELKTGLRPIEGDPGIITSPCDAIVGACGLIDGVTVIQAKGFHYALEELLHERELVDYYRDGWFATLRLTASMYHRFHAPYECEITGVTYIAGDTWNVDPISLARVEKLFCRNERVIVPCELAGSAQRVTLVLVAAILVASVRLHFVDVLLHLKYRGATRMRCAAHLAKGQEMGWFQHGSTVIVFAPRGMPLHEHVRTNMRVKVGQPLFRRPDASARL